MVAKPTIVLATRGFVLVLTFISTILLGILATKNAGYDGFRYRLGDKGIDMLRLSFASSPVGLRFSSPLVRVLSTATIASLLFISFVLATVYIKWYIGGYPPCNVYYYEFNGYHHLCKERVDMLAAGVVLDLLASLGLYGVALMERLGWTGGKK
ncbi:hypothetical protein BJ508DRAFT_309491 [Ascobolus immersus RN42]|uniref:Uncharacterized protein n=1 Tax=Ascobolus immersus RN42 TaxID=1160509 RepID=A0A3N4I1N0_ASCIM|nr:hypothetical protein BJ508DRAFT_309491 [Ascobolus immersus RN42]